jgi:hypothetical protein
VPQSVVRQYTRKVLQLILFFFYFRDFKKCENEEVAKFFQKSLENNLINIAVLNGLPQ